MDKKIKNTHNGIISFWKFMFCIMVVLFHITEKNPTKAFLMENGRIAIEFFFLVSGYLMAKTALNKKDVTNLGEETFQFIWKKIKFFFPYVLSSFFIYFFVRSLYTNFTIKKIVNSVWELLFLDMSGIKHTTINGVSWYLSSMLISMWILYPLIRKYKKNYLYIIAPLIVYFLGGWLGYNFGNLSNTDIWCGITLKGTLRAIFDIALGTIIYNISTKLKNINLTFFGKLVCTIIETTGFISVFIMANKLKSSDNYEFIMLLILCISVTLAFSEKNILYKFANNKIIYYLEKLTIPIFLNQSWVIMLIIKYVPNATVKIQTIAIFTYLISFSMLYDLIIDKIKKLDKRKLKLIFIKENSERKARHQ